MPEVKTGFSAKLAVKSVLFPCEFMLKPKSICNIGSVYFVLGFFSLVLKILNEIIHCNPYVGLMLLKGILV